MIDTNELRRLAQAVQGSPRNIHEKMNAIHNLRDALPSGVVLEILDRLEAAEKSLSCCQAERNEAAELFLSVKTKLLTERDTLRAKITEMEKQEPYSYIYEYANPIDGSHAWRDTPGYWNAQYPRSSKPLYLAPGAKPAPSLASGDVSLISEGKTQPAPSVPETWLEQGLKELDAIRQNSNRDDWQPNDENIVRRLYQAMVAYGVQQAPSVPHGWKLVPIEPTEEMMMRDSSCQKHAHDDQSCVHRTNRRWIWKTMLAAAPEANRDAP